MLPRYLYAAIYAGASFGVLVGPIAALAQTAAPGQTVPSRVTPQTMRPNAGLNEQVIVLPGPSAIAPAAGNSALTVEVGDVQMQDAFPDMAVAAEAVIGQIRHRRLSVAQIYAAASELERIYGEAGYPLVRIVLPPQSLIDHGQLRFVVVDGFIESIDVDRVPAIAQDAVAKRTAGLVGRRHLKLVEIERSLLIAGDVPGLKLRSTLARGSREGGVRLLLEGGHDLVTGSIGIDNRLSSTLGTWQLRGAVALNNALGVGEQIYGTAGSAANLKSVANGTSPLTIYGGGVIVPIGVDGVTINPEYTRSTTSPIQTLGVPASLGTFERFALRLRAPISLTRKASLYANFSLEEIDQQIAAPDFGVTLNHDHYRVVRAGADYTTTLPWGTGMQAGALMSAGLGGRSEFEVAASGIPLSRLGASPGFAKLSGNVRFSQPLPANFRLDLNGAGQLTGGKPMLRPEQIGLDGSDAVSAFASGSLSADQGMMLRGEVSRPFVFGMGGFNATASPYVFGAAGRGWLANATSVEQSVFDAGAVGLGVRGTVEVAAHGISPSLALEVARGFTNLIGVKAGWRASMLASVTF
jgi:hemolysin activation/secretion protein